MLGTLRLVLAMIVAAFHLGWMPGGVASGVAAVTVFYVISGYAMTGLLQSRFENGRLVAAFYRDRVLRLGPQYYAWSLIAMVGMALGWHFTSLQEGSLVATSAAAVAFVIPLGAWMYVPAIGHYMPLPQAWSLSTELAFYCLFPFLLRSSRLKWASLAVSVVTFTAATANIINPDYFAYRLLPGALVFFLLGHALIARERTMAALILVVLIVDMLVLSVGGNLFVGFNTALFIGGLSAAPLIVAATVVPSGQIDRQLGAASYGCYLSHWLFLPMLAPFDALWWAYPVICALSGGAGWLMCKVVEEPVTRFRHRKRVNVEVLFESRRRNHTRPAR